MRAGCESFSGDALREESNGIWMCDFCARRIDVGGDLSHWTRAKILEVKSGGIERARSRHNQPRGPIAYVDVRAERAAILKFLEWLSPIQIPLADAVFFSESSAPRERVILNESRLTTYEFSVRTSALQSRFPEDCRCHDTSSRQAQEAIIRQFETLGREFRQAGNAPRADAERLLDALRELQSKTVHR